MSRKYNYVIYIYIFIEPSSFVRKLLPQRVCDGRETRPYFRVPHGECHKGVGGKRFVTAEKSAAQFPTLTEIDAMFSCVYEWRMRDSGHVVCKKKKAVQWQEETTLALSGTQRHLGGPLCTNKQQKLHVLWFAQVKLPDSLL